MKIIHYGDIPSKNLGDRVQGRVVIGKEDGAGSFCMRVFELEPGGHTPLHAHRWEHEIFIHRGSGVVLRNGEWVPVREGTAIFIPGGEEHQIKNIGNGLLIFVCLIPSGPSEL